MSTQKETGKSSNKSRMPAKGNPRPLERINRRIAAAKPPVKNVAVGVTSSYKCRQQDAIEEAVSDPAKCQPGDQHEQRIQYRA